MDKRELKITGYWPSSFLCVYIRDRVEVHKHSKTERGQYLATPTEQVWLIKYYLIIWNLKNLPRIRRNKKFSCGRQCGNLVHSGNQSQRGIWFILPVYAAGQIIIPIYSHLIKLMYGLNHYVCLAVIICLGFSCKRDFPHNFVFSSGGR